MAITHTHKVLELIVVNDGSDIVSEVIIDTTSTDSDNPSLLTMRSPDVFKLDTSGGTSATGFVPYASLTESTVLSWITSEIDALDIKTIHEREINERKDPTPTSVSSKALPF